MSVFLWIVVFFVSLVVMVKGADWFLDSAEKIGLSLKISPFLIGITIVAMGTSLPELFASLFGIIKGAPEVVVANAVGSNIANILLIIGIGALVGKKLVVSKSLIDLDLPLLATGTVIFGVLVWDGKVTLFESIVLLMVFLTYLLYTIYHRDEPGESEVGEEDIVIREAKKPFQPLKRIREVKVFDIVKLLVGGVGLVLGAQYLISSVVSLSEILAIGTGVIAVSAVAFGTSLPELLVSGKAALQGKSDVAVGNIFGSNIFNMTMVVGIPGLITSLPVDGPTMTIALPFMVIATLLFVLGGISKKIYIWEGAMFLILYLVFIGKLFGFM